MKKIARCISAVNGEIILPINDGETLARLMLC
jgi:hypothetical protein